MDDYPNGVRPAPFSVRRWRWVVADDPAILGFAVEVPVNITVRERREFNEEQRRIAAYAEEWVKLPLPERSLQPEPDRLVWALLAPLVHDWNAVGERMDGTEGPIPPPAVAGPDAFLCVDTRMVNWIVRVLSGAYTAGKGLGNFPSSAAGSTATPAPASATSPPMAD